jgi:hypothetical protein
MGADQPLRSGPTTPGKASENASSDLDGLRAAPPDHQALRLICWEGDDSWSQEVDLWAWLPLL